MTKFYRVTCYTPFIGEENDYYIATDLHDELIAFADDCAYENALEWCDDQTLEENDMTEDDYYAECGYRIREISEEEYRENAWGV